MGILSWDKPERIMSVEAWTSISADSAPPGVYMPNMSRSDMRKWKAKLIKGNYPRVEIRKTASSQILIIVSLTGNPTGTHKRYNREKRGYDVVDSGHDVNVKISMNGPAYFSFDELPELEVAILEAKKVLENI